MRQKGVFGNCGLGSAVRLRVCRRLTSVPKKSNQLDPDTARKFGKWDGTCALSKGAEGDLVGASRKRDLIL